MIRNTRGLGIGEALKLLNESKKPVLSRKRPAAINAPSTNSADGKLYIISIY